MKSRRRIMISVAILISSVLSAYASYFMISHYVAAPPEIPKLACRILIEHVKGKLYLVLQIDRIEGNYMEWKYLEVLVEINGTTLKEISTNKEGYVYPGDQIPLGYVSYGEKVEILVFYMHQEIWEKSLSL